jgi:hypothetical protein
MSDFTFYFICMYVFVSILKAQSLCSSESAVLVLV